MNINTPRLFPLSSSLLHPPSSLLHPPSFLQCAAVGFDMVILSFGSGLDWESSNRTYLNEIKDRVDYAKARGIEVAG